MRGSILPRPGLAAVILVSFLASPLLAHPTVENALDIVIDRNKITVDARISFEQVLLVEGNLDPPTPQDRWQELAAKHEAYVLSHLKFAADAKPVAGKATATPTITFPAKGVPQTLSKANYHFEYALEAEPQMVRIDQDMLREHRDWMCSCIVRIRRSDQPAFQMALLSGGRYIEFDCEWSKQSQGQLSQPAGEVTATDVGIWPTIGAYCLYGIEHILRGLDHLLFISALVLAARGFWDLFKVVTMFTIAHTLTLALSVLNILTLSERIVEPMIAASIVFVAVQNIFWPKHATGWSRLAVAFLFGLFHGLGFAGGLKEAMSEIPALALGLALVAFSLGVEIGHQVVVIPLFVLLQGVRRCDASRQHPMTPRVLKLGSLAISIGGVYFFIHAIR